MSYNLPSLGCSPFQVDQYAPTANNVYVYCTPSGTELDCFRFTDPVDIWSCPRNGNIIPLNPQVAQNTPYINSVAAQNTPYINSATGQVIYPNMYGTTYLM